MIPTKEQAFRLTLKLLEKAPAFSAATDEDGRLNLSDYLGKINLVLYFYPKDETPGCTKEACTFRDNWDRISAMDAKIVGISRDSISSHKSFKEHHSLPFTLVSDVDGSIAKLYGLSGNFLMRPRVTFVIDKEGTIRLICDSQVHMARHVKDSIKALQEIRSENNPS